MEPNQLPQRLVEAREEAKLTQTQLAKRAGCSQALIGNLEAGSQRSSTHLPKIAAVLGVDVFWLQHGTGQKKKSAVDLDSSPDIVQVPRVKFKLSAGVSGFGIDAESGNGKPIYFRGDWFDLHNYKPEKLFAVRVSGASMEPSLWDGDLVVINTDDTIPHDGDVFALNYEGEMVIKRMQRDAGVWFATSDNQDQRRFQPKRCTEDVIVIGRVIYKQSEHI